MSNIELKRCRESALTLIFMMPLNASAYELNKWTNSALQVIRWLLFMMKSRG